jgi:hypothetical protein
MDLTSEIKQFAAENELEIKERVRDRLRDYFDSTISENYHEKWDQGVLEHGPMTDAVLEKIDWAAEAEMEMKDSFWYETLILFRQSRGEGQG